MGTPTRRSPDDPLPRRCGLCAEWHTRPTLTCQRCDNLRRCPLCGAFHRRSRTFCAPCERVVRLDQLVEQLADAHTAADIDDELLHELAAAHADAEAAAQHRTELLAALRRDPGMPL